MKTPKLFRSCVLLVAMLFLMACNSGATPYVGYQPPGIPVTITIDIHGRVQVEWHGSYQTPIGTFSVGVNVDPAQMFPNADGTLTVRIDGNDVIYDLGGNEDINIHLDSGYYKEVNLQKTGKNWLFEVVKISENAKGNTPSSVCGGAPSPHLSVGSYAYVSNNPPVNNRVREGPGLNYTQVGSILNGHSMKVLSGPQCNDGYYWWKVQATRNANVVGWTAEGDSSSYWLVPCNSLSSCP